MNYKGKVVLITGSSRGIGNKLCHYFLGNDATVIGLSKSHYSCPGKYHHYRCDLSDGNNIRTVFRQIAKDHGKIDILVNNAAILTSQYAMIMPISNATEMVQTNLLGTFFVSREAAKIMRKNNFGRIINIGSMAASLEPIGDSIYAATKSGINSLANVMAKELSSYHITCNTIGITAIETDMLKQLPKKKIDEVINGLTIPRYATPEDIFNVVDFFAAEGSSNITAQIIYLGGVN